MSKTSVKTEKYGLSRYFLLTLLLSFLGWAFEMALVFFMSGKMHDRGFMTMPFCPIYGCSILAAYLIAGTPDEGRGLLRNVDSRLIRHLLYLGLAFILPSLAELVVGAFFDKLFGVWLWDYSDLPLNLNGYVALPVSLAWTVLLFLFMKFLFTPLKNLVGKIPKKLANVLAILLLIAVAADVFMNFKNI